MSLFRFSGFLISRGLAPAAVGAVLILLDALLVNVISEALDRSFDSSLMPGVPLL